MKKYIILTIFALINVISAFADNGWKLHPSFDNQPIRIIDTPRYCYYFVHCEMYNAGVPQHVDPTSIILFRDKEVAGASATALHNSFSLTGENVAYADYNPYGEYLLIVYENYDIDLLYQDGTVSNISDLKDFSIPGMREVRSATFNPGNGDALIATDFGYAIINSSTRTMEIVNNIQTKVEWVASQGDELLIFAEGKGYSCSRGFIPGSIQDFKPLMASADNSASGVVVEGTLQSPQLLMPLTDSAFAFLGPSSGGVYSLNVAVKKGNKWSVSTLAKENFLSYDPKLSRNNIWERNGLHTADGYLLYYPGYLAHLTPDVIEKGIDALDVMKSFSSDSSLIYGSSDFKEFESYSLRKGFYTMTCDGGEWSVVNGETQPEVCSAFISDKIIYHPEYGMLVVNHGNESEDYPAFDAPVPVLIGALKNGRWTNYGPAYNIPEHLQNVSNFPTYHSNYFPLRNPMGMGCDPENSSHLYFGSVVGGIARIDLASPAMPVMHICSAQDTYVGWKGAIPVVPSQSWYGQCCFSNVEFDREGRMWTMYFNFDGPEKNGARYQLWHWTSADRKASADANENAGNYVAMHAAPVSAEYSAANFSRILPLKKTPNENRIVAINNQYAGRVLVYDHHGNPDQLGGITQVSIDSFRDDEGVEYPIGYPRMLFEDEETGYVWLGHSTGVCYFDPADFLEGRNVVHRPRMTSGDYFLNGMIVRDMCRDEMGRYWFATSSGIRCVDADFKYEVARYSSSNSPLQSDDVFAVGWNPDTHTLLASTQKGIAEVDPEIAASSNIGNLARIYPAVVSPDYFGVVAVANVESTPIDVYDSRDKLVATIVPDSKGVAYWSIADDKGMKARSGRYFFRLRETGESLGHVNVLK